MARTLTTIGRFYGSLGLIDEASDCFTRALDLIMTTNDTRVKVEVLSEKMARHYEAETVGGDPSAIEGPQREVGFTATGVRIAAKR